MKLQALGASHGIKLHERMQSEMMPTLQTLAEGLVSDLLFDMN